MLLPHYRGFCIVFTVRKNPTKKASHKKVRSKNKTKLPHSHCEVSIFNKFGFRPPPPIANAYQLLRTILN